jgi:chemotaxis protein methyltransferase CheR
MPLPPPEADRLTPRDFKRIAAFIEETVGIRMPPAKKNMVEGRLRRRVRAIGLSSLQDYCAKLFDGGWLADEAVHLIDALTTNKTEFFREPEHFQYLRGQCLPALAGAERPLKLWSAASSIGAEAYSLAMVLDDFGRARRGFRFGVMATDVCTEVLAKARQAVYPMEMAASIPPEYLRRYALKARDPRQDRFRIRPELRQAVSFGRLNLMEEDYPVDDDIDVIFCRNILIYFDKPRQAAVLGRLCRHLRPGGYLFVGHSETLVGTTLPVEQVATTVYRKVG